MCHPRYRFQIIFPSKRALKVFSLHYHFQKAFLGQRTHDRRDVCVFEGVIAGVKEQTYSFICCTHKETVDEGDGIQLDVLVRAKMKQKQENSGTVKQRCKQLRPQF